MENLEYYFDAGWFRNGNRKWHSNGCINDDVDNKGECCKCAVAYNNINRTHHPKLVSDLPNLFQPTHAEVSVMVSNQMEKIDESAILNDEVLKLAAGMLSLGNEYDRVQVGKSKVFLVCFGCHDHRLCRRQKNLSAMCRVCQKKKKAIDWKHMARHSIPSIPFQPQESSKRTKVNTNHRSHTSFCIRYCIVQVPTLSWLMLVAACRRAVYNHVPGGIDHIPVGFPGVLVGG